MKRALICGVSGQDGAYLARLLLEKGYAVIGTSRDAQSTSFANLDRLGIAGRVEKQSMVLTDRQTIIEALGRFEPDEVYNLAGQSSVALSFRQPVETFESIANGTLNLLEAIRITGLPIRYYNAGSSECFGDTAGEPATENTPFAPRNPYATAKASAHWTVANYREAYGLFACTGILFNHESPLRPKHFVTRKIVTAACEIAAGRKEALELGDISISRDWGWAPEYVDAMWRMLQQDRPEDFVIATGESHTLEDFCRVAFDAVGLDYRDHLRTSGTFLRPSDIPDARGDPAKAERLLGWRARTTMPDVVRRIVEAERKGVA
jgi:GDPmannose 4,6-dehydratase